MLFFVVRVLHLLAMVVWLGTGLSVPAIADIERTLALPAEHHRPLLDRLRLITFLAVPAAVATVITGVVLVQLRGGFFVVSWRFSAALVLSILTFALGAAVSRKALGALEVALAKGDLDAAKSAAARFRLSLRFEEAIRLAIFFLMVLPL